jgi:hypothetical protein
MTEEDTQYERDLQRPLSLGPTIWPGGTVVASLTSERPACQLESARELPSWSRELLVRMRAQLACYPRAHRASAHYMAELHELRASDLPKGPKGGGLVVFNIQDRIQLCFLHHVLHVFCWAKQLQFALVIPHAR